MVVRTEKNRILILHSDLLRFLSHDSYPILQPLQGPPVKGLQFLQHDP
jgi:hypothetical protein